MQKIKSIKSRGELVLIEDTNHHVRVFGIEAIPELLIQYDQELYSAINKLTDTITFADKSFIYFKPVVRSDVTM